MSKSDAELLRSWSQLVESTQSDISEEALEEAFPVLKQKMAGALYRLGSKFSSRMEGHALIKKALVPYLKAFVRNMGIKGKDWNTVTWKEVLTFLVSPASLHLPLGEFEPQRLTIDEIDAALKDPQNRAVVASFLEKDRSLLPTLMPMNVRTAVANKVGGNTAEAASLAQRLLTGVFTVMIRIMIEKAEGAPDLVGPPPAPTGATGTTGTPTAPTAPPTPTAPTGPPPPPPPPPTPTGSPPLDRDSINVIRALFGLPPI